eukprot:COSAG06_NODE_2275_length_7194_cov_10.705144_6_plen_216_part_00
MAFFFDPLKLDWAVRLHTKLTHSLTHSLTHIQANAHISFNFHREKVNLRMTRWRLRRRCVVVLCIALAPQDTSMEFSVHDRLHEVSKNGLFEPFICKNEHFTKTGSGRTQGKLKKKDAVFPQAVMQSPIDGRRAMWGNCVIAGGNTYAPLLCNAHATLRRPGTSCLLPLTAPSPSAFVARRRMYKGFAETLYKKLKPLPGTPAASMNDLLCVYSQ